MTTPLERLYEVVRISREERARWRQFLRLWERIGQWCG